MDEDEFGLLKLEEESYIITKKMHELLFGKTVWDNTTFNCEYQYKFDYQLYSISKEEIKNLYKFGYLCNCNYGELDSIIDQFDEDKETKDIYLQLKKEVKKSEDILVKIIDSD